MIGWDFDHPSGHREAEGRREAITMPGRGNFPASHPKVTQNLGKIWLGFRDAGVV